MNEALKEFDSMCQELQSADEQARSAANAYLTHVRDSARAFETCFAIVDSLACSELARSTAAVILRQALVRSWSSLSVEQVVQLRAQLLNRVVSLDALPRAVRAQLVETAAILVKRSWCISF